MQSAFLKAVQAAQPLASGAEESGANQSVVILITGFVVVFLVLLLLIGIIKIYSTIVSSALNKSQKKKETLPEPATPAPVQAVQTIQKSDDPDLQTVAVIAAAVEAFYGKNVKIRNIRPVVSTSSDWARAGLMENIPAMRTEGLL